VVLFTSNFLDKKKELGKEIDEVFAANPTMELLVPGNLHDNSGKIKYTTALKYKGLEKDIVILVAPAHQIKEIRSLNQLLVGASRAKLKLYLLIYS